MASRPGAQPPNFTALSVAVAFVAFTAAVAILLNGPHEDPEDPPSNTTEPAEMVALITKIKGAKYWLPLPVGYVQVSAYVTAPCRLAACSYVSQPGLPAPDRQGR